jgi:hypothetical protein
VTAEQEKLLPELDKDWKELSATFEKGRGSPRLNWTVIGCRLGGNLLTAPLAPCTTGLLFARYSRPYAGSGFTLHEGVWVLHLVLISQEQHGGVTRRTTATRPFLLLLEDSTNERLLAPVKSSQNRIFSCLFPLSEPVPHNQLRC